MADYVEHGEVPVTVTAAAVKAGAEEKMSGMMSGAANKLSPQIEIGNATVNVNAQGVNTQAVEAEVKLPKLKPGEMTEADKKPTVQSTVNNDKLGSMLTKAGYADMAQDLQATNQAMKLDNVGGMAGPKGKMQQDPRLAHRMNMMHRKSAGLFGLAAPGVKPEPGQPKLDDLNKMNPAQQAALVAKAQANNPDLKNGRTVEQVNAEKLKAKEVAMKNPDNVEKIKIGMTGLNFKNDRKIAIEKNANFVPKDKLDDVKPDAPKPNALKPDGQKLDAPKPHEGRRLDTFGGAMPRTGNTPSGSAAKLDNGSPQIKLGGPTPDQGAAGFIADSISSTLQPDPKPAPKQQNKIIPSTAKMAQKPSTAPGPFG